MRKDPYQLQNVVNQPAMKQTQQQLEALLTNKLNTTNDEFLTGNVYMDKWHYPWAAHGLAEQPVLPVNHARTVRGSFMLRQMHRQYQPGCSEGGEERHQ